MAGTIVIAKNFGVAMNSISFDHIIERIRHFFNVDDEYIRSEIYRPVDEGGMSFISVKEQDVIGFNAFLRAADSAFASELLELPQSPFISVWDELFDALRADTRCALTD